jgi:hypothetical protein
VRRGEGSPPRRVRQVGPKLGRSRAAKPGRGLDFAAHAVYRRTY